MLKLLASHDKQLTFRATHVFDTYDERKEFASMFAERVITVGTCATADNKIKPYAWFEVTFKSDDDVTRYESFMRVVAERELVTEWTVLDDSYLSTREEFLNTLLDLSF